MSFEVGGSCYERRIIGYVGKTAKLGCNSWCNLTSESSRCKGVPTSLQIRSVIHQRCSLCCLQRGEHPASARLLRLEDTRILLQVQTSSIIGICLNFNFQRKKGSLDKVVSCREKEVSSPGLSFPILPTSARAHMPRHHRSASLTD
jgi:hypothetical protein